MFQADDLLFVMIFGWIIAIYCSSKTNNTTPNYCLVNTYFKVGYYYHWHIFDIVANSFNFINTSTTMTKKDISSMILLDYEVCLSKVIV